VEALESGMGPTTIWSCDDVISLDSHLLNFAAPKNEQH
jgi:hypothetical protein